MKLLTDKFLGAFARLSFSNGVAIGFAILSGVVSARLYGPSEIGITVSYLVSITIAAYLIGGRYDYVLFRADVAPDHRLVVVASAYYAIASATIFVALIVPILIVVNIFEILTPLPGWIYLAPISVLSSIGWTATQSYYNARGDYVSLSNSRLFFSILSSTAIIFLSLLKIPGGIVIGGLVAQLTTVSCVLVRLINMGYFTGTEFNEIRRFVVEFRDHPLKLAPTWVINVLAQQAPVYALSLLFSPAAAGMYTIANKACYAPVQLLSTAAGDLFREVAAKKSAAGELKGYFSAIFITCAVLGFPLYLALIVFGVPILEYILGEKWHGLSDTLTVMAVLGYFQFTLTPLDKVALAFGRSTYVFSLNISRLLGVFLIGYVSFNISPLPITFIMLFVGFSCILYVVDFLYGYRLIVKRDIDGK